MIESRMTEIMYSCFELICVHFEYIFGLGLNDIFVLQ